MIPRPRLIASLIVGSAVTLGVLSGCSGQQSEDDVAPGLPPATASPEITDRGTYDADNEEMFSIADHSCDELKQWYDSNPGDSNVAIAEKYGQECEEDPPPVLSGELIRDDFDYEPPLDVSVLQCDYDPYTLGEVGLAEVGFSNNSDAPTTIKITLTWNLYGQEAEKVRTWTVPAGKTDIWAPDIAVQVGTDYEGPPTCSISWVKK